MNTTSVLVGIMTVELVLPDSHSLKAKRMVLNRLRGRLRNRNSVAVAEMDHQDAWQRSGIAVVAVGGSQPRLEKVLDDVRTEIELAGAQIAWEEREFR